jgi:hypothetical protein
MSKIVFIAALLLAVPAFGATARADEKPTNMGPLSASENAFVQSVQKDLLARYPHVSAALKAGYVRYTSPDDTGAISYANRQWNSDPTHPSQLWYDKDGNLMGADFAVPRSHGEPRPQIWGIDPGRWFEFNGHVHYVVREPDGTMGYDGWVWDGDFAKAGGDPEHPSADTLVKIGRVPSANYVATIFNFPTQWDLIVWVRPHSPNQLFW